MTDTLGHPHLFIGTHTGPVEPYPNAFKDGIEPSSYIKGSRRNGAWMQTYSGITFWPCDPQPEDITIEDIAHALAHQCRFGGHCKRFYSVAEHSALVSLHGSSRDICKAALLHDASEAYLVDVPRPVKRALAEYRDIEHRLNLCIAERFGVEYPWPGEIHQLDNAILADEREQIMNRHPASKEEWGAPSDPLGVYIIGMPPLMARDYFTARFNDLFA